MLRRIGCALAIGVLINLATCAAASAADKARIARGEYLVNIVGCGGCHSPGVMSGHPDPKPPLAGSADAGFVIDGLGVFYPPNLTPDRKTGIGTWSEAQIVTAITTGVRPDGRILAPIMPWSELAHLTKEDAFAIAAYLKTLKSAANRVPGPFGPRQMPVGMVIPTIPAADYAKLVRIGAHK